MIRFVHSVSGSRIRILIFYPSQISDPLAKVLFTGQDVVVNLQQAFKVGITIYYHSFGHMSGGPDVS